MCVSEYLPQRAICSLTFSFSIVIYIFTVHYVSLFEEHEQKIILAEEQTLRKEANEKRKRPFKTMPSQQKNDKVFFVFFFTLIHFSSVTKI